MAEESMDLGGGVGDPTDQLLYSDANMGVEQDSSALGSLYEGQETDYLAHAGDQYLLGVGTAELGENPVSEGSAVEGMETGVDASSTVAQGSSTGAQGDASSSGRVLGTLTELKQAGVGSTVAGGTVKKTTVVAVPSGAAGGLTLGSSVQTVDQGDGTVTIVVTPGQGITPGRITTTTTPGTRPIAPASPQKIVILPAGATVSTGTGGTAVTAITGQKGGTTIPLRYISAEQMAALTANATISLTNIKASSVLASAGGSTATASTAVAGSPKKMGRPPKDPGALKTPKVAALVKKTPASTPATGKKKVAKVKSGSEPEDDDEAGRASVKKKGVASKKEEAESLNMRKSSRKSTMSSKLAEWGLLPSSSGSVLSTSDSEADSDDVPIIKSVVRTYTKKVGGSPDKGAGESKQSIGTPGVSRAAGKSTPGFTKQRVETGFKMVGKEMQNKSLMCKPIMMTKATSCNPIRISKSTQTDEDFSTKGKVFVPVPVPLVVPAPMNLYNTPTPVPIPIPVPLIVPAFIPTSKSSLAEIIQQLKELHDSMPSDPLEADLLNMADTIATAEQENPHIPVSTVPPPPSSTEGGIDMMDLSGEESASINSLILSGKRTIIDTTTYSNGSLAKKPRLDPGADGSNLGAGAVRHTRINDSGMRLKYSYGVNAWLQWVTAKNEELKAAGVKVKAGELGGGPVGGVKQFKSEILTCSGEELSFYLSLFIREIVKPTGESYAPDSVYYLCLGIQYYLYENGRIDNIFHDSPYTRFIDALNDLLTGHTLKVNLQGQVVCRITEEQLWETRQLGPHSPYILLNTLIYFNTKHFLMTSSEAHLNLSFSNIMKQWKKNAVSTDGRPARTVYLRYNNLGAAQKSDAIAYEQLENTENPLRCPVKLYEFYLAKCPETIKHRNDMFYLVPEPSCMPESPVWYSATPLSGEAVTRMLNRISVVKEIQETQVVQSPATYYG